MTDLRFALRQLTKSPGYTAVVVLTLALGIAVNSTIFGMLNAFFLQRLPVPESERLVLVLERSKAWKMPHGVSFPDFKDYRERSRTVTDMVAFVPNPAHLSAEGKTPERAWVEVVTPDAFQKIGVPAALGRTLLPSDGEVPGGEPVAVLSHHCWQQRFGGDPDILGRAIVLNGRSFTVVGVAREGFNAFSYGLAMSAFVPTGAVGILREGGANLLEWRTVPMWRVLGRRTPGLSLDEVRAEIAVIEQQIASAHPDSHDGTSSVVIPENHARPDPTFADFLPVFSVLFAGLVSLVLCIACANVANLMFARAATRQKELTMRAALGATRSRLIRQLLIESLVLAAIAGVVAWALADWTGQLLARFAPQGDIPIADLAQPTNADYLFSIVISAIAGLASGLLPALRASRIDLVADMKEGGAGMRHPRRHRLRNMLVIGQVAFSLIVLIGAGLFLRSLQRVATVDLGFRTDHLLLTSFDLSLQGYSSERGDAFHRQLLERTRALPGIEGASLTTYMPFDYGINGRNVYPENPGPELGEGSVAVKIATVAPGFIEMLGVRMRSGRTIADSDTAATPRVAVINDTMAGACWPGQEAVGKRFRPWKDGPWIEVVGVTDTAKYVMMAEAPTPFYYAPLAQDFSSPITLAARTSGDPATYAASVRAVVHELDPHLPVFNVRTMDELMGASVFALLPMRMGATLAGVQGAVGLLLAVMGLYAVVAFGVTQRTREIGIRMAIGAQPREVVMSMLREGVRLTLIGLGIGLLVSSLLGFGLSKVLYGLAPFDPLTVFGVTTLLLGIAWLACWLPARRATKVNPIAALRAE